MKIETDDENGNDNGIAFSKRWEGLYIIKLYKVFNNNNFSIVRKTNTKINIIMII